MAREALELALQRIEQLEILQGAYPHFVPFCEDGMIELGFSLSDIQADIAEFLEFGPHYLMIQAQRGQAKTTICALFAVWCLIHDPKFIILIISAGGTQANEISTLIVRVIMTMELLECLRPDRNAGDRTSVEAFDVHHTLKGLGKSPSVACVGVTGNLQGKRADLLIADDVESAKNSLTEHQRQALLQLTRDFPSICSTGRIVYLGTPQSINSIYNTLPGRGYTVRIWPGRYPTQKQMSNYGDMLAPYIRRHLEANPDLMTGGGILGDQGQPVDLELPAGNEEFLAKKENDQGPSYFQLQHMLNTKLADAERFPLRLRKIISLTLGDSYPLTIERGIQAHEVIKYAINGTTYTFATTSHASTDRAKLQGIVMYVDPAGGGKNGDETGYAVVGFLNGTLYALEVGGVKGGFEDANFTKLTAIAAKWKVNRILVEKNFGNGAYLHTWLPSLRAGYKTVAGGGCAIEETWESGQKELRIIDVLEPIIARGSLVFNDDIMRDEEQSLLKYPAEKRSSYSLLHQIAHITREKNALQHDDRLDALAGACRYWVEQMGVDQARAIQTNREKEFASWIANPLAKNTQLRGPNSSTGKRGSAFNKYRR